ncbi:MAG: NAD(P)H-hydrate dehydratase [Opitutus sp.]
MIAGSHPILSLDEAKKHEATLFHDDEAKEWPAMSRAGAAIASAIMADWQEIGGAPANARILVLVGKGHNGADALIAAKKLLETHVDASVEVLFVFGERRTRPLLMRAWQELAQQFPQRMVTIRPANLALQYDLCIDGIFGFQFRPPVEPRVQVLIQRINSLHISLRAAVDLSSGGLFKADFTYATGIVKSAALDGEASGRLRYLDLGFFHVEAAGVRRVLTRDVLLPLNDLRPARSDKRTNGHVFVMGGSRSYPGAVLMAVEAALRSGVGLLTAFVPESLSAAFAARVPEAIWVGCPEAPEGGLALESLHLIQQRIDRATAWLIGPGVAREAETHALIREVVRNSAVPLVLDADALQRDVIGIAHSPVVVTPHAGEYFRIAGDVALEDFTSGTKTTVVLKGPITRIAGQDDAPAVAGQPVIHPTYYSFFGGPVLARGGSGDILAGLIAGLLAQNPSAPLLAAARGTVWHGYAADLLARTHGQVAVTTTQLLEFLPRALRDRSRV